jgi:ADP-heptose:LPS heptosyltransferase
VSFPVSRPTGRMATPMRPRAVSPAFPPRGDPPALLKILLIRRRRIGDVVLSTPLIRALRTAFPRAELHYMTAAPCGELLHGNPRLDRVLAYPADSLPWTYAQAARRLSRARYDVVIDLEGTRSTALLTRIVRAPIRIGYDADGIGWAYTHPVREERTQRYWF